MDDEEYSMDDEEYSHSFHITVGDPCSGTEASEEVPLFVGSPSVEITVQEVRDSNEESVAVQTPEQVNSYRETLFRRFATQKPLIGGGWSIFRVPAHVREVENGAYTPKIVSIGPFHNDELGQGRGLRAFEVQKMRFLSRLQNRVSCEVLQNAMKEMEEKTRKCYSEDFHRINSDDFVRMMLLDGFFIVELLRLYTKSTYEKSERRLYILLEFFEQGNHDVEEPILETRWMVPNIGRDLLMLENQLPMFVLQKIFDITTLEREGAITPLNKLALRFFEPLRPGKDELAEDILNTESEYPHLLALFQSSFMTPNDYRHSRPDSPERDNLSKYEKIPGKGWVHNAQTLTFVGIRFKSKSGNFLDIEYKNRKLKIPTLFIDDGTSTLLRNLIAYEQSDRCVAQYFSCLAVFMDSIVDTVDDINILRRAGIIKQPKGGDQEVVNLFNSLTKGVEIDMNDCYIIKQIENINRRCQSHEVMVRFRRFLSTINYFKFFKETYLSAVLTLISIWYIYKDRHDSSASPPPSPY